MRPNDLMVGDFVRLKISQKNVVVHAIDYDGNVSKKHVVDFFFCDGECSGEARYNYNLDVFEPIPLTPEILLKNGFTHCNYEGSMLLEAFCWVEFNEARNGCMFNRASIKVTLYRKPIMGVSVLTEINTYSTKGDGVNKVHSCDIESVHELQHALRLCGIEKEIIL